MRGLLVVLASSLLGCGGAHEPAPRSSDAAAVAGTEGQASTRAASGAAESTSSGAGARNPSPIDTTETDGAEGTGESGGTPSEQAAPEADPLRGEVGDGESLSRILNRAGLSGPEIHQIVLALEPTMDPTKIRAGQRYAIELAEDGSLASFELARNQITRVVVEPGKDGKLSSELVDAPTETREVLVGGVIDSSLWAAITGSGEHPSLVSFLVDVFAYDLNFFTDTRPGDRFRMIVEKIELEGEFVKYGRVLAAEYAGKSETHRVYWFDPSKGEPRYVDEEGRGVARTLLKTPLKFSRISSEFNPKRMHPILHRVKGHNGVDYAAPEGTPVWSAAEGRITVRDKRKGAGNMVIVAHANGMTTLYMHLSRFADGQKVGTRVKAKTVIGYVGMTGLATGPHLHFGLKVNGRYTDPNSVEKHRGPGVPKADRAKWNKARKKMVARLDSIESAAAPASETTSPAAAEAGAGDSD